MNDAAQNFLLSESFLSTLLASAFGALFGAWGAQLVISRKQARDALVSELNSISAALGLCFSVCNLYIALKKQHVKSLRDNFNALAARHAAFQVEARANPGVPRVFAFQADFRTLNPVETASDTLLSLVFEKISIRHRGLGAAVALSNAISSLNRNIEYRNQIIRELRDNPLPPEVLIDRYLGLVANDGSVDERYPNALAAIYDENDQCIFYSQLLAKDLWDYGRKLRRRNLRRLNWNMPDLPLADWTQAQEFLPKEDDFKDWLKGYKRKPTMFERGKAFIKAKFVMWPFKK